MTYFGIISVLWKYMLVFNYFCCVIMNLLYFYICQSCFLQQYSKRSWYSRKAVLWLWNNICLNQYSNLEIVFFEIVLHLMQCWLYSDVIMSTMASQITVVWIVCSTVCSGADQRKRQSPASLDFVRGIHWWPVDSPHKEPVTWKMFPFDDIMICHQQNPQQHPNLHYH